MKQYFGYIRVSTARQGEQGVSLQEQRDAISRCAQSHELTIAGWFEERETAAKHGRPIFGEMLKRLRGGEAQGVIIHKIDRSARNLRDWADLGELIDRGIDVVFANENLDLQTRGGRLSADIQAVVAADYIRNLREETRKGIYGRLKQGLYPMPAPIGYIDQGKGKAKQPDPINAPLVAKAFKLYATGRYNLLSLEAELLGLGLRNRNGHPVTRNGLSTLLNNPFYVGLIRIRKTSDTYAGIHEPLISRSVFEKVQQVLQGKYHLRPNCHDFVFRRLVGCGHCHYSLIGERQKGHVYYRCHTRNCPTTGIREEFIDDALRKWFQALRFSEWEQAYLRSRIDDLNQDWEKQANQYRQGMIMRLGQIKDRLNRMTDAYLDGLLDKDSFERRKTALFLERHEIESICEGKQPSPIQLAHSLGRIIELSKNACLTYENGIPCEKRDLVELITSNRSLDGKNIVIELKLPFSIIAQRPKEASGTPKRDRRRILDHLLDQLVSHFKSHPLETDK